MRFRRQYVFSAHHSLVELGKAEKLSTFVVFENGGQVARPPLPGPVETYSVKSLRGKASLVLN